ncbi:methyltransferase domain-containing protein [Paenibacillus alvei]|uniref:methyltransferase domain-containing protein n=1 Tax=Paenibacillus alvei TaxID=44250 RepID=UPI002282431B|nr:methyltransferase domain-containing protein [Paenibacillus alvei]
MFKYNYEVNLDSNNSASHIVKLIEPKTRVLEFGCATGYMSRVLVNEKKCSVVGVEIDAEAASIAEKHCEKVIVGDIEQLELDTLLAVEEFDYIIFADVLEHLKHPDLILEKCLKFLKQDGFVLASIPNIAHLSIILNLVKGQFRYQNIGLLDNTHLKFFTKDTVIELFETSGYTASIVSKIRIMPQFTEFSTILSEFPSNIIERIYSLNQEADTYQFIVKAAKSSEKNRIVELYQKISSLNIELLDKQKEINSLQESIEIQQDYTSKLESAIRLKDEDFKKLESYATFLEQELNRIKADSSQEQISAKLDEAKREIEKKKDKIEEQNYELSRINTENSSLKQLNDQLMSTLELQNEERNNLNLEITNLKLEMDSLQPDVEIANKVRNSRLISKLIEWKN